jgi:hypothetical protein
VEREGERSLRPGSESFDITNGVTAATMRRDGMEALDREGSLTAVIGGQVLILSRLVLTLA